MVGEELYGTDGEIQHMNFPDEEQKVLELEKLGDISLSEVRRTNPLCTNGFFLLV